MLTLATVAAFRIMAEAGVPTETYSSRPCMKTVFTMFGVAFPAEARFVMLPVAIGESRTSRRNGVPTSETVGVTAFARAMVAMNGLAAEGLVVVP